MRQEYKSIKEEVNNDIMDVLTDKNIGEGS